MLDELNRLGQLDDDRDGQGAAALDPANLSTAVRWVEEVRRWPQALAPAQVAPGTTGEVVLEWRGNDSHRLEDIRHPHSI